MNQKLTDYDQLFPGRFLKAGLFNGKAVTLTIADVELEELPDRKAKTGTRKKAILSFRERDMQLVLNRTNGEAVRGMFGRRLPEWIGKRVTFAPKDVEAFGVTQLAIRVIGSPDIERDIDVLTNIGGKQGKMRMRKTEAKGAVAVKEEPPETEPEYDGDTGEVYEQAAE